MDPLPAQTVAASFVQSGGGPGTLQGCPVLLRTKIVITTGVPAEYTARSVVAVTSRSFAVQLAHADGGFVIGWGGAPLAEAAIGVDGDALAGDWARLRGERGRRR